ncbi:ketopantoate reductase family protein [Natrialbaceae archaeon A-arb3/5]
MEIVVFGAGSLGSLVGGALAIDPAHDVTLVARRAHAEAVAEAGLEIEGEIDAHVSPAATADGSALAADLAIVTVKSYDTPTAAETLATGSFDAVLSLQNGMGNEETLSARLDVPVLAGVATCGAILESPGVIRCTGLGKLVLGAREGEPVALADRVGQAFVSTPLEAVVAEDMPRRLWEKLAVNAGINAVTALTATENSAVLERPANEIARAATRETARIARADGVILSNREALAAMERVATETADNTSSMRQDILAGRRTEIDAINGYVVERADEYGLDVPTNQTLSTLVQTWERGQNLR